MQRGLFDPPPASHRDDPRTSHAAERAHTRSGKRASHCQAVLAIVEAEPGLTALQIAARLPWEQQEARRRLTDLLDMGLVRQGAVARRHPGAKAEVTWWPIAG